MEIRNDPDATIPCTLCTKQVKYYELTFDSLLKSQGLNTTGVSPELTDRLIGRSCGPLFMYGYSEPMTLTMYDASIDAEILNLQNANTTQPIGPQNSSNTGLIAGITVACAVVAMVLGGMIFWFFFKRKNKLTILTAPRYSDHTLVSGGMNSSELSSSGGHMSEDLYVSKPDVK